MSKYTSSLSRASSTGSIANLGSAQNTDCPSDDEDSDSKSASVSTYKERRREAHTQAEQKRRDAIKKGYDYLQDLVPTVNGKDGETGAGYKISKATVLQKSIEYIVYVQKQKRSQEDDVEALRKEVIALNIMRQNYEQLVKVHQAQPNPQGNFVPGDVKFKVFQQFMDTLFQSFAGSVNMANFSELSGTTFSWLENQCKPQVLQEIMYGVIQDVRQTYQQPPDLKPAATHGMNKH